MQKQRGNLYTFLFATIICIFCSVVLAVAATALKPNQEVNARLDIVQNILRVVGYTQKDIKSKSPQEALALFKKQFQPLILDKSDQRVDRKLIEKELGSKLQYPEARLKGMFSFELLQLFNKKKALLAKRAGKSLKEYDPGYKTFFVYSKEPGKVSSYIIPISGSGLWDIMYGYLALEADLSTVKGITFYEHKETPGLGAEFAVPPFTQKIIGKQIFTKEGKFVSVTIAKGKASDVFKGEQLKHNVDGISGATLTAKGINMFMKADLEKFIRYFEKLRSEKKDPEAADKTKKQALSGPEHNRLAVEARA